MNHYHYKLLDYFFALDIYANNILEAYNDLLHQNKGDMSNIECIYGNNQCIHFEKGQMVNWEGKVISNLKVINNELIEVIDK